MILTWWTARGRPDRWLSPGRVLSLGAVPVERRFYYCSARPLRRRRELSNRVRIGPSGTDAWCVGWGPTRSVDGANSPGAPAGRSHPLAASRGPRRGQRVGHGTGDLREAVPSFTQADPTLDRSRGGVGL